MANELQQTADLIERFLAGTVSPWEWDDFLSVASANPAVEAVRLHCAALPNEFPRNEPASFCGPEGLTRLKELANSLRLKEFS